MNWWIRNAVWKENFSFWTELSLPWPEFFKITILPFRIQPFSKDIFHISVLHTKYLMLNFMINLKWESSIYLYWIKHIKTDFIILNVEITIEHSFIRLSFRLSYKSKHLKNFGKCGLVQSENEFLFIWKSWQIVVCLWTTDFREKYIWYLFILFSLNWAIKLNPMVMFQK